MLALNTLGDPDPVQSSSQPWFNIFASPTSSQAPDTSMIDPVTGLLKSIGGFTSKIGSTIASLAAQGVSAAVAQPKWYQTTTGKVGIGVGILGVIGGAVYFLR